MRFRSTGSSICSIATAACAAREMGDPRVIIATPLGEIRVRVALGQAPVSARAFLTFADRYAGGLGFWRAVDDRGDDGIALLDIVQGGTIGDSTAPAIRHEPTSETGLRHVAGAISLARMAPGTATGDCFFICASDNPLLDAGSPRGDGHGYAVFGQVEQGLDVLRAIQARSRDGAAPIDAMRGQMLSEPVPILSIARP